MKRYLIVLLLLAAAASCKKNTDHLPVKEMSHILMDIHLAESYSTTRTDSNYKGGAKNMDSLASYYKDIFAHYNITAEEFNKSLDWYKAHPDQMDSIYTAMMPAVINMQKDGKQ